MTHKKDTYADTHCHLDFEAFDLDRNEVIERARIAGLKRILNPGVDLASSKAMIRLADQIPEVFVAVGVHPNSALSWDSTALDELENLSRHPKVVAIGEIGLDYYRAGAPGEAQRRVFLEQLDLASRRGLPVIVHNRDSAGDIMTILSDWIGTLVRKKSGLVDRPGVLHSFSGNLDFAQWAIENKFYIGITGPVTYRSALELQQVVTNVPLERLLIETDGPFLPPHPHRGKRNEPAHVGLIAGKIAELRAIEKDEVAECTSRNAARLFRWRDTD